MTQLKEVINVQNRSDAAKIGLMILILTGLNLGFGSTGSASAEEPWKIPDAPEIPLRGISAEAAHIHELIMAGKFQAAEHLLNQAYRKSGNDASLPTLRAMILMMRDFNLTNPVGWVVDDVQLDGYVAKPYQHAYRWLRTTAELNPKLNSFVADAIMEAVLYSFYSRGSLVLDDRILYLKNGPGRAKSYGESIESLTWEGGPGILNQIGREEGERQRPVESPRVQMPVAQASSYFPGGAGLS